MGAAAKPYVPPGATAPRVTPTAIKREVDQALRQIADGVAALPEPYLRAMAPILDQAQRETTSALADWLATHPNDGAQRFTAQHLRQAQLQLRAALIHAQKRVPDQLTPVLTAMGASVGKQAMKDLQLEVSAMAGAFGHSVRPLQFNQAAIIAEGSRQLIPQHRNSANRYGANIARDIRNQLAIGVVKGETFDQLTNRLVKLGGPKGLVALRGSLGDPGVVAEHIGEGLFKRYRFWAERVVRTECSEAYSIHALNGLHAANEADPGYEKRWDAALVRDRTCPVCKGLDGKAVELDAEFPGGFQHPPAHPLCLCTLTPWRPEWGGKAENTNQAPPPEPAPKPKEAPPPKPAPKPKRTRKPPPAPPPRPAPPAAPPKPPPPPAQPLPAPKPKRTRKPKPAAPPPPPAPAKPDHVVMAERVAAGDFNAARRVLEGELERDGYVFAPQAKQGTVAVADLPSGVAGLHRLSTGEVTIDRASAIRAKRYGQDMPRGFASKYDAEGVHVLVHEVIHGSGPVGPLAYSGSGALIEEVSTEVSSRRYMAARFGVRPAFAYNGEIGMVQGAVEQIYKVTPAQAEALVEDASHAFRKNGAKTSHVDTAIRYFASGFPAGPERTTLVSFFHAYHKHVTGPKP